MSLQFIIGSSGVGKSHFAYSQMIEKSLQNPKKNYYVIVPEQFTMQTQKILVDMHPGKGILNIDVLSFERLAYRIFEEVGGDNRSLLEETGKSMLLRKVAQQHQKELPYLGSQIKKPGCLNEVKSLVSEFLQYEVREEELREMTDKAKNKNLLYQKLKDVEVLYHGFLSYLEGHYLTGEEVLDVLVKVLPLSKRLKGSEFLFDGYTGFTPIQIKVLGELLNLCGKVMITVTMDSSGDPFRLGKPHQLFYMSRKMIHTLSKLTKEMEEPVLLKEHERSRFKEAPDLNFLERHLFRYRKAVYEEKPEHLKIFSAANPREELLETARRIRCLIREKNFRYGEIAVITGNMEEYGSLAGSVFKEAGIPFFLDEKHTILMNPFVEYIRAALDMVVQGFTYESVFRYLRCGMSDVTRSQTDQLENYVLALGIKGLKKWQERWVRLSRGMSPEDVEELNRLRSIFVEEVEALAEGFSKGKKTVESYCRSLYAFVVKSRVQEKLKEREQVFANKGDKAMEKEYAQIYGLVMELLDKMVELLGAEEVTKKEFQQLLETGLTEAKVALIPPSMDQVLIGDMERTRLKDIRALFFVGVREGNIPKNTESGGLLTEMDREFFGQQGMELAPGPKELLQMQRFYLYLNLTKPRELLCLSYSLSQGNGEAAAPAYLIHSILGMFPALFVEKAEQPENPVQLLETPKIGMYYFLSGLSEEEGMKDPLFQELYSWYLNEPSYREQVQTLVEAAFARCPSDVISESVAKAIYGEVSPYGATRLERFAACAFAHFLQYGLKITERAEYEFRAMDMGNVMHQTLERFARELRKKGLKWAELTEETRNEMIDNCLDEVAADYGNTIMKSSARNAYMIQRTRRILHRTAWALQEQLKKGEFEPEGFEVSFGGGRIDRLDTYETENKVYVKVIDYKTGNTSFDLVALYHGLQLQLMVYLDAAVTAEKGKYPHKEVEPAGVFYYNIKDPMIQESIQTDVEKISQKLLRELKMNGLVQKDMELARKIDETLTSLPVSSNKDGSFRKGSSVASREQFQTLQRYIKKKIEDIRTDILSGNVKANPYELEKQTACTYCPYQRVCVFDKKLPGYEYRRLKAFSDDEIWNEFAKEVQ